MDFFKFFSALFGFLSYVAIRGHGCHSLKGKSVYISEG